MEPLGTTCLVAESGVVGAQCLSKLGAETVWKAGVEVLVHKSQSFDSVEL